jgi:hypothetical protein
VLDGYPGITASLQRLIFDGRLEPLVHRFTKLKHAVGNEDDLEAREHGNLLISTLERELKDVLDESLDQQANGVATFGLLWTLFKPGEMVYSRVDKQDRVYTTKSARYVQDADGSIILRVACQYVDWVWIIIATFLTCRTNYSHGLGWRQVWSQQVPPQDPHLFWNSGDHQAQTLSS